MDVEQKDLKATVRNGYFESYDDFEVHKLMLEDEPRTLAYKNAIEAYNVVKDKVVLDVGAGTGILSLFCMNAGAKRVYAVEASNLAITLQNVIKKNKAENVIKVIHGRIEEVNVPEEVDVIVSEWMGFYLLHESMLDSVIFARDKYLKKDPCGIMLPSHATLYAAPCSLETRWIDKSKFWNNVYGFDMSPFGTEAINRERKGRGKPEILSLNPTEILSEPEIYADFDLLTIAQNELNSLYKKNFVSINQNGKFHGIALWFDCKFVAPNSPTGVQPEVTLSTSPWSKPTHWKQTVIVTATSTSNGTPSLENEDGQDDPCSVEEDEVIGWEMKLERVNSMNGEAVMDCDRQYTISVHLLDPVSEAHPSGCKCMLAKCALMQALEDETSLDGEEIIDLT